MSEEKDALIGDFSILDLNADMEDYDSGEAEVFYQDLNLLQIIDRVSVKWGKSVKKYFMHLPKTPEGTAYRRAVYGDIKKEPVYLSLTAFTEKIAEAEKLRGEKHKAYGEMQKAVWWIREAEAYYSAYEELAEALEQAELESSLQEFLRIIRSTLGGKTYRTILSETRSILEEIRKLRFTITYDKDRMSVALKETEDGDTYESRLIVAEGIEAAQLTNPFIAGAATTELENACIEVLQKKKPAFFRKLSELSQQLTKWAEQYNVPAFTRFEQEIRFYLSFCSLQREMEKAGFAFAEPEVRLSGRMEAEGLYDLALALMSIGRGGKVVPNDFYLDPSEQFFVLTGPNQGGKTTFARSLGQLVFFTKLGLDVPAKSATVLYFSRILTHFSVEASVETGRGKLMDELVRLAPMMESKAGSSFVVINELFTTAASYDAVIMGKRVLDHFTELGDKGIYVTHLKELADACEGVVSLRAMLDEQGIQTFEIRRGQSDDGACAENQVKKYHLTYEQLKERL